MREKIRLCSLALGVAAVLSVPAIAMGRTDDQSTLLRNSYFGSSAWESAFGIAEAPDGTYYITGMTNSRDLPGTSGGAQPVYGGGNHDIFVAHFAADMSRLMQATYIGGPGDDRGYSIAFNPVTNRVYVAGSTTSAVFPRTLGSAQPRYAGQGDTVVVELTADLAYMHATYLGGSGDDTPCRLGSNPDQRISLIIAPDSGDVYVSGATSSVDFPNTVDGAQSALAGGRDGYVAMLTPDLNTLLQATYLGGSDSDLPYALALSPQLGLYVVGSTASSDFPGTSQGVMNALAGPRNAFVARLDPTLRGPIRSTYFGGGRIDDGRAVAIDAESAIVYISGSTSSRNLPFTQSGAQAANAGGGDAFVAALSSDLSTAINVSYLGGSGLDMARSSSLALDPIDGGVYVAGTTTSRDFPATAGGVQADYPGLSGNTYESFVTKFTPDLTQLVQSTYLGGSLSHTGIHALVADPVSGALVVAFGSGTPDLPNTDGSYQPFFAGGGRDGGLGSFPPGLLHP